MCDNLLYLCGSRHHLFAHSWPPHWFPCICSPQPYVVHLSLSWKETARLVHGVPLLRQGLLNIQEMSYIVLSPRDVTAKKSISKLPQNLWVDNRNQINNFLCDYQYWVQVPGHCTWILPWFIPDYFPSPYHQVRSALNTDRHTFIPSESLWCHNIGQYHNEHLTSPISRLTAWRLLCVLVHTSA